MGGAATSALPTPIERVRLPADTILLVHGLCLTEFRSRHESHTEHVEVFLHQTGRLDDYRFRRGNFAERFRPGCTAPAGRGCPTDR